MKKLYLFLVLLALIGVACNFGASQSPETSPLTPFDVAQGTPGTV